jgi:hypothetical protein
MARVSPDSGNRLSSLGDFLEESMKQLLIATVLAFCPLVVCAADGKKDDLQYEARMGLRGSIVVGADGSVREYTIDDADKLTKENQATLDFVQHVIQSWKFDPQQVDGQPVNIKNRMYLGLAANKREDGNFEVRMTGVHFQPWVDENADEKTKKIADLDGNQMTPPRYPVGAMMAGAEGVVYLLVKVGKQGQVEDVIAEQVNLPFRASPAVLEKARKMFANASIDAAKKWKLPSAADTTARIPVDYCMKGSKNEPCAHSAYARWNSYVAGPRQKAPWDTDEDEQQLGYSLDALPAGGIFPVGEKGGLKLLTSLQQGG